MKHLLQKFARRFDVELLPSWKVHDFALARHLNTVLSAHGIKEVIDVGANGGAYGEFLRREVDYTGAIRSFETEQKLFEQLKKRSEKDKSWSITLCGLGDVDNSSVSTLDSALNKEQASKAGDNLMLKLDAQDRDLSIVAGAVSTLQRCSCLQVEIHLNPKDDRINLSGERIAAALDRYSDLGFELSGMFPVQLNGNLLVTSLDCVLINRSVLQATRLLPNV